MESFKKIKDVFKIGTGTDLKFPINAVMNVVLLAINQVN